MWIQVSWIYGCLNRPVSVAFVRERSSWLFCHASTDSSENYSCDRWSHCAIHVWAQSTLSVCTIISSFELQFDFRFCIIIKSASSDQYSKLFEISWKTWLLDCQLLQDSKVITNFFSSHFRFLTCFCLDSSSEKLACCAWNAHTKVSEFRHDYRQSPWEQDRFSCLFEVERRVAFIILISLDFRTDLLTIERNWIDYGRFPPCVYPAGLILLTELPLYRTDKSACMCTAYFQCFTELWMEAIIASALISHRPFRKLVAIANLKILSSCLNGSQCNAISRCPSNFNSCLNRFLWSQVNRVRHSSTSINRQQQLSTVSKNATRCCESEKRAAE